MSQSPLVEQVVDDLVGAIPQTQSGAAAMPTSATCSAYVSPRLQSPRQSGRQLGVDEETHLGAPQYWVVVLARGELENGRYVIVLEEG